MNAAICSLGINFLVIEIIYTGIVHRKSAKSCLIIHKMLTMINVNVKIGHIEKCSRQPQFKKCSHKNWPSVSITGVICKLVNMNLCSC